MPPPHRATWVQVARAYSWEGTTCWHRCRSRRTSIQSLITRNLSRTLTTTSSPGKISITPSATWSSPGTFQWGPPKTSFTKAAIHTTGPLIVSQIRSSTIPLWPPCPPSSNFNHPCVAGGHYFVVALADSHSFFFFFIRRPPTEFMLVFTQLVPRYPFFSCSKHHNDLFFSYTY